MESTGEKKQMLKAVEQRDRAVAAAVAAAKARYSSPSKVEKVIRKKEVEIYREFRRVKQQIQEELLEENPKELTEKAAARAEIEWPDRAGWTLWAIASGSHQETRKQLQDVEEGGWLTAPGGHVGNNAQQSKHAAKNGSVYRLKAAEKNGGGPTDVFIADGMETPELPEGWELAEEDQEDVEDEKTPDPSWPTSLATSVLAPMGGHRCIHSPYETAHMHALTHHTSPHTMAGVSLASILKLTDVQRSNLAGKIQKSKKVKMTTVSSIFEAACGPEDFSGSKGTKVGWLLAQLNEEMVEAAGQDEEQDS